MSDQFDAPVGTISAELARRSKATGKRIGRASSRLIPAAVQIELAVRAVANTARRQHYPADDPRDAANWHDVYEWFDLGEDPTVDSATE